MTDEERLKLAALIGDLGTVQANLGNDTACTITTVGGAIFAGLLDIIDALRQDTVRKDTSVTSERCVCALGRPGGLSLREREDIAAHIRKLEATR